MPEKSEPTKSTGGPATPGPGEAPGAPDNAQKAGNAPKPGNDWVDDGLRKIYDDIAAEPLPQDLLDLLNQIDPDKITGDKNAGGSKS